MMVAIIIVKTPYVIIDVTNLSSSYLSIRATNQCQIVVL